MRIAILIFFSLLTSPIEAERSRSEFIVWNVGQGLWTTWVHGTRCTHFDSGGERAPWRLIRKTCLGHEQRFDFSHWDRDHISFAKRARELFPEVCLERRPAGETLSPKKLSLFTAFPICPARDPEIADLGPEVLASRSSNEASRVFEFEKILVPGDSPATSERNWAPHLARDIQILVLGHHGSRTSTSDILLAHLPKVRQAVASSRKAKYGHPHREVVDRLKAHGIALITTEDWGSIRFERPAKETTRETNSHAAPIEAAHREPITDDTAYIPCSSCERRARRSRFHRKRSGP